MLDDASAVVDELRQPRKVNKGWANLVPPKKGECRNPRGRPKKDFTLAEMAQKHAANAIAVLAEVMADKEATPNARVAAASELLDRGFGRAPQSLDVKAEVTLTAEFENFIRALTAGATARVIEHSTDE